MRTLTRGIAALELALIFPAALFMSALVVRNLAPLQYEPAHTADLIVMWYSARMWTLWLLLLAMPFAVLLTGCVALLGRSSRDVERQLSLRQSLALNRASLATLFVAATTLTAGCVLVVVVLHMLAD